MEIIPTHLRRRADCDCSLCCDACGEHTSACMSGMGRQTDIAEEVAQEDGYMH